MISIRRSRSFRQAILLGGGLLVGALGLAFAIVTAAPLKAETVLKFAATVPLENPTYQRVFKKWIDQVNEDAKGEFHIQAFGLALANSRNVWERTRNGVADIGWALHGTVGIPFPKTSVITLPLLVNDGEAGAASEALWKLYDSGLIADEYKDVKVIGLVALPVQGLAAKSNINSLSDISGKKIRVADKLSGDIAEALGGSPISLSATEVYQALSRGVVDSAIANWIMMGAFKLTEVSNEYVTGVPLGSPSGFIVMNPNSYANLSNKGKQILERHIGAGMSRQIGTGLEGLSHGLRSHILKSQKDYKVVKLDDDQQQRWAKALQGIQDKWVADTPDGKKILETFKTALEKAKK